MVGQLYFQKSFNPPYFQLTQGNLLDNERAVFTAVATPPSAGGLPLATGLLLQNLFVAPSLTQALFPALDPVKVDLTDGRIFEWTFDVQRQLGSWLLDVGYVGTRGLRLPFEWDPNQPEQRALYGRRHLHSEHPGEHALPAALPQFPDHVLHGSHRHVDLSFLAGQSGEALHQRLGDHRRLYLVEIHRRRLRLLRYQCQPRLSAEFL